MGARPTATSAKILVDGIPAFLLGAAQSRDPSQQFCSSADLSWKLHLARVLTVQFYLIQPWSLFYSPTYAGTKSTACLTESLAS